MPTFVRYLMSKETLKKNNSWGDKSVIYWPSTAPSIKRCTCVDKRKNSGSRCTWDNNISRCPGRFGSVGEKMPKWEPAADRGLWALSDPRLSNPAKMRKKCRYGHEKNLGQNNSPSMSPLTSHTQETSPFRE